MGVKGLWSLLNPVSRPVQIESMEGKRMAIDSSIWLYQFQATMRDKDGRVLVNAHVLGFLRRINKLLFHGIKPVFVFDGGAPVLKRSTIAARKQKKAGAAANHARMAEKLFSAQMRREAVKVAQTAREQGVARLEAQAAADAARYYEDEGDQIAEGAVYLDELEGQAGPSRLRIEATTSTSTTTKRTLTPPPDPREERRKKFRKMDPYRLPEASMPTVSTEEKPDARLATEAELKQFIDEVHPEDIDIESPEFRALPTEVQYEIVGDMRVRSRQTSHKRLADMLRAAPSALDFSMAQIKNLSQRNTLTQQLFTVTDSVGQAHLQIPVRIAAERNREYVLVKRDEAQGGGWALGIREGSKQKPIEVDTDDKPSRRAQEIDSDTDSEYSDGDIQEVAPPPLPSRQTTDPDIREHRRREVLEAIAARYTPKKAPRASLDIETKAFGKARLPGAMPLFESTDDDDIAPEVVPSANDEALALALQQEELGSDEEKADLDLARALAISRREADTRAMSVESIKSATSEDSFEEVSLAPSAIPTPQVLSAQPTPIDIEVHSDEDEDMVEVEAPLAPATLPPASIATPPRSVGLDNQTRQHSKTIAETFPVPPVSRSIPFGRDQPHHVVSSPTDLQEVDRKLEAEIAGVETFKHSAPTVQAASAVERPILVVDEKEDDFMEIIPDPVKPAARPTTSTTKHDEPQAAAGPSRHQHHRLTEGMPKNMRAGGSGPAPRPIQAERPAQDAGVATTRPPLPRSLSRVSQRASPALSRGSSARSISRTPAPVEQDDPDNLTNSLLGIRATRPVDRHSYMEMAEESVPSSHQGSAYDGENGDESNEEDEEGDKEEDEDDQIEWSRSPSLGPVSRPPLHPAQSGETIPSEVEDHDEDMAPAEMVAEQDDYARFMASIRNRDLNEVRGEIDDEIRVLNNQNKVAMRDSDEITQAMVAQIQTLLRHYGIPYITAPMEAEAQCAKLAELGLVDGIITDDSDVFLFGGSQCFKNIFNDAKYAECFLTSDIERELALSRERLISLAYLLGSDYTIGLPGVGPVVALELLSEFPGPNGIDHFKTWWTAVQRGQDTESETNTKWKKSFKKRFAATILLTADWPNHLVREAYKYPVTDESEEPFHWGFPKLSALRSFLHEELSWSISKVDDELTPIVQRIARRGKVGQLNKQATLDPFFDLSAGSGNYAPRRRTTANVSKRLLAVIKAYREAEARVVGGFDPGWEEMMVDLDAEDPKGKGTGKRRSQSRAIEPSKDGDVAEGEVEKPKPRKPRKKKSESEITTGDNESAEPTKKGRPRRSTASSVSMSEIGKESMPPPDIGPSSATPEIAIPKNGLRGSATGVVGSGKRKKAALKAWRDSTRSQDLGPS